MPFSGCLQLESLQWLDWTEIVMFSDGMSEAMSQHHDYVNIAATFNFVNIAKNSWVTNVTEQTLQADYDIPLVLDDNAE